MAGAVPRQRWWSAKAVSSVDEPHCSMEMNSRGWRRWAADDICPVDFVASVDEKEAIRCWWTPPAVEDLRGIMPPRSEILPWRAVEKTAAFSSWFFSSSQQQYRGRLGVPSMSLLMMMEKGLAWYCMGDRSIRLNANAFFKLLLLFWIS